MENENIQNSIPQPPVQPEPASQAPVQPAPVQPEPAPQAPVQPEPVPQNNVYQAPAYQAPKQTPIVPPSNNLALAIVSTLLCCWPLGIVAIYHASQVDRLWFLGDHQGSMDASEKAKKWSIATIIVGAVVVLYVAFCVLLEIYAQQAYYAGGYPTSVY